VLQSQLAPIGERRAALARDPGEVLAMVRMGSERARDVAASVLRDVRQAFSLNYE
jgi:tryptophanyl-tRNA synthetase